MVKQRIALIKRLPGYFLIRIQRTKYNIVGLFYFFLNNIHMLYDSVKSVGQFTLFQPKESFYTSVLSALWMLSQKTWIQFLE